jgi:Protein of unknown function (DUF2934)
VLAKKAVFDPFRFSKPPRFSSAEREKLIAEAAYWRAEKRGFAPGFQLDDWLAAEVQIDIEMRSPATRYR